MEGLQKSESEESKRRREKMKNAKDLIVEELREDADLRKTHLKDAIACLIMGESRTGRLMLRNIVNATIGFEYLQGEVGMPAKSIMRMLSAAGNPNSDNLFKIINFLIKHEGLHEIKLKVA